jgi:hypothetical protein
MFIQCWVESKLLSSELYLCLTSFFEEAFVAFVICIGREVLDRLFSVVNGVV